MSSRAEDDVWFEAIDIYLQRAEMNAAKRYDSDGAEIDLVPEGLAACLRTWLLARSIRGTPMHKGLALVAEDNGEDRCRAQESMPDAALIEVRRDRRGVKQKIPPAMKAGGIRLRVYSARTK